MLGCEDNFQSFGPEDKLGDPPEVVIIDAHSFGGHESDFANGGFSDVFDAMKEPNRRIIERYMRLEAGAGVRELAVGVAGRLAPRRVGVLSVPVPPGILDSLQLDFKMALRKVFNENHLPRVLGQLHALHSGGIKSVRDCISRVTDDGMVVFLHSMSPFNRRREPNEGETSLEEYIESFTGRSNRDVWPRGTNILTATVAERECELLVGRELVDIARRSLGLATNQNAPFGIQRGTLQYEIAEERPRTLIVDVPKHLLLAGASREEIADKLDNPIVDDNKIEEMAARFAGTINTALSADTALSAR